MFEDNSQARGAASFCRLHKLLLAQLERLAAHKAGHKGPGDEGQRNRYKDQAGIPILTKKRNMLKPDIRFATEDTTQQDGEKQARESEHDIGEASQELVYPSAKV